MSRSDDFIIGRGRQGRPLSPREEELHPEFHAHAEKTGQPCEICAPPILDPKLLAEEDADYGRKMRGAARRNKI